MQTEMLRLQMNQLVTQARHDLYALSALNANEAYKKPQMIQRLWDTLSSIHFLTELLAHQAMNPQLPMSVMQPAFLQPGVVIRPQTMANGSQIPPITPQPLQAQTVAQTNQRIFTIQQLAAYNGKNGMPAYVAVNGIVYDVTNNRAWAAATHFGLTAGKDYTQEFASCHAGMQSILATLPVAGRLA